MKPIFIVAIIAAILFTSCNNQEIKVKNPEKITTLEIINKAQEDSNIYKIYIDNNNTTYCLNLKNNKVEYLIVDYSKKFLRASMLLFALFLIVIFLLLLRD